jgi:transposase-like protein
MSESPNTDEDESPVSCPACESENTVQITARGLTYQCRDCNNEFGLNGEPME